MLIPAKHLQSIWGLKPDVLLHIGAHEAEELDDYVHLGWGSDAVVWVEALPGKADKVRSRITELANHSVVNAVLWDNAGEHVQFQETSNGQSSSAFELKDHSDLYHDITVTKVWDFTTARADEVLPFDKLGRVDLVNIDIQGAELRALQGFGDQLDRVDAIYSEVNLRELYSGIALFDELDAWLSTRGFVLVDSELLKGVGWGDALWLRASKVPSDAAARRRRRRRMGIPSRAKFALWNAVMRRRNAS